MYAHAHARMHYSTHTGAHARAPRLGSIAAWPLCALGTETDFPRGACSENKVSGKGKAAAEAAAGDRTDSLKF